MENVESAISGYLLNVRRDLIGMRAPPVPLQGGKLPEFGSVDPWDGKDGEVRLEREVVGRY